ncbi:MAG: zinc ribbon domain-containing protein [Oscillospiraceae bacterium]|nr:zinc ribbon domain-containing protein [Oscillospiraceae bacterium]
MFCNKCGEKLQEGGGFCAGCGTKANSGGTTGTIVNLSNENIESGVPFTVSPASLHNIVAAVLSKAPNIALDVFEKVKIVREEHHCVPAYWFDCNGTAKFSYEFGKIKKWQEEGYAKGYEIGKFDSDTYHTITTHTGIDWIPTNGETATRETLLAPANKEFIEQIQSLYLGFDFNNFIDFHHLNLPADTKTHSVDLPVSLAYNEYVTPHVKKKLEEKAEQSMTSHTLSRSLQMLGENISKEKPICVFLSIYRVVFQYNTKEYSVWVNGDGSLWFFNETLPEDENRKSEINKYNKTLEDKNQELLSLPSIPDVKSDPSFIWFVLGILTYGIGSIVWIYLKVTRTKKRKESEIIRQANESKENKIKPEIAIIERKINSFNTCIAEQYKSRKKALAGIYEDIPIDTQAFEDILSN